MTECAILYRVIKTGKIGALLAGVGCEVAVFDNRDEAIAACHDAEDMSDEASIIYQIVELDEL
jgi:hypothetical protein